MDNCEEVGVLHFDGFELDISNGELRTAGTLVSLQPQPFKVLALLAGHSGQAVSRQEIRRQLWGNETFVDFDGGVNFCVRQIRKALGDDARSPRYIGTLPRRGYRFLAPVNRPGTSESRTIPLAATPNLGKDRLRPITVAVLPFSELSTSAHANSLGDALTELLIAYFTTNQSVRVVSRTSTMRYKHTNKSLPKIAKELGAHRVLEGAVLHSGGKVRITARLIDPSTDQNEWAACYETDVQDWLELQDDIARAVIRDTSLHLDLRLEERGIASRLASAGSSTAGFQVFQLPSMPGSNKRLHA
ncbi:MAG: winged helix-turn-helix domain-containing protein [Candidatus Dormibacteria bacterium]